MNPTGCFFTAQTVDVGESLMQYLRPNTLYVDLCSVRLAMVAQLVRFSQAG